jgi:O-antigen ligase
MDREKRKIFGQMLVDVVKYLFTIIVIGSIFAETVKIFPIIMGLIIAIIIAFVAYKLIPPDKKED